MSWLEGPKVTAAQERQLEALNAEADSYGELYVPGPALAGGALRTVVTDQGCEREDRFGPVLEPDGSLRWGG